MGALEPGSILDDSDLDRGLRMGLRGVAARRCPGLRARDVCLRRVLVGAAALLCGAAIACDAQAPRSTPSVGAGPAPVSVRVVTGVGVHGDAARFELKRRRTPGVADVVFQFGSGEGEWPIAGDWDGDGFDTIGVFRPETSSFHLRSALAGGPADRRVAFGDPRMAPIPVVGDWDGDGVDTFGVYARADSSFHLTDARTTSPSQNPFLFGPPRASLWPIAGDWDGDGRDGVGLYDPEASIFHLANGLQGGVADVTFAFGAAGAGMLPVVGDWVGDGRDRVGLYDPRTARFLLRHTLDAGPADETFVLEGTPPNSRPLAGRWLPDVPGSRGGD